MKKSDFKYFYIPNFLDKELHESMLEPSNHLANKGILIDENGIVTNDSDQVIKNRFKDNSVLFRSIPEPMVNFLNLAKNKIIEQGAVDPVVFNINALINPTADPKIVAGNWHKDYNLIPHITDPHKLWFTMLSLSKYKVTSEFMISPDPDGPELWGIGVREVLTSNKLFGHTINLGHQYFQKEKNDLVFLYTRWYDAA